MPASTIVVSGCETVAEDGTYRYDGNLNGACKYSTKTVEWAGAYRRYCIYRCKMSDSTWSWFISMLLGWSETGPFKVFVHYISPRTPDCMTVPPGTGWQRNGKVSNPPLVLSWQQDMNRSTWPVDHLEKTKDTLQRSERSLVEDLERADAMIESLETSEATAMIRVRAAEERLEEIQRTIREWTSYCQSHRTKLDQIKGELVDVEERMSKASLPQCIICEDRPKEIVFQCGHQCCDSCSRMLDKCHTCRRTISQRIKLFH